MPKEPRELKRKDILGMSADELFSEAATTLAQGDYFAEGPSKLSNYQRAGALASMATMRAIQEANADPSADSQ